MIIGIIIAVVIAYALFRALFHRAAHGWYLKKAREIMRRLDSGDMVPGQKIAYLKKINPYVFEELVLIGFGRHGYKVTRNRRYSGDGGIDGRVSLGGEDYLIQCKRYKDHINPAHVEAFAKLCMYERKKGFFVHTGKTGTKSRDHAGGYGHWVKIISGNRLVGLLDKDNDEKVVWGDEERGGRKWN